MCFSVPTCGSIGNEKPLSASPTSHHHVRHPFQPVDDTSSPPPSTSTHVCTLWKTVEKENKKKASSELEHLPIFNPPDLRALLSVFVCVCGCLRRRQLDSGCLWCLTISHLCPATARSLARSIVHRAVSCHSQGQRTYVCLHASTLQRAHIRHSALAEKHHARHHSPLVFELNFIGASAKRRAPHTTSASSSSPLRKADSRLPAEWMDVHRLASLFLSSYSSCYSTHLHIFATHRFGLFTFACGFTIFSSSSLPHLTVAVCVVALPHHRREMVFASLLGRALFVLRPSINFFSVASWKRYREDVLKANASPRIGISFDTAQFVVIIAVVAPPCTDTLERRSQQEEKIFAPVRK